MSAIETFMLRVAGSTTAFVCRCGCNVFHKRACDQHPNEFECNACKQRYDGGKPERDESVTGEATGE